MATERDQPWWADAQEYRHRDTRRRNLDDDRTARSEDEFAANAARRRRAASARAAAQQRRARQDRSDSPRLRRSSAVEYQWIDESPFAPREHADRGTAPGDRGATARDRSTDARNRARPGTSVARRSSRRPARRRASGPIARPEKLLLYIAILGLFLVLAAATNSDAAVVVQHAASLPR